MPTTTAKPTTKTTEPGAWDPGSFNRTTTLIEAEWMYAEEGLQGLAYALTHSGVSDLMVGTEIASVTLRGKPDMVIVPAGPHTGDICVAVSNDRTTALIAHVDDDDGTVQEWRAHSTATA